MATIYRLIYGIFWPLSPWGSRTRCKSLGSEPRRFADWRVHNKEESLLKETTERDFTQHSIQFGQKLMENIKYGQPQSLWYNVNRERYIGDIGYG